jgi:peroxiredoxin
MELEALQSALPEIRKAGAELVAVSPQLSLHSQGLIRRLKLGFPILSDVGNVVASKMKISFSLPDDLKQIYLGFGVDLQKANGDESWVLPLPARYIIDQDSVIQYAELDPDYTVRPEPEHTILALKDLST